MPVVSQRANVLLRERYSLSSHLPYMYRTVINCKSARFDPLLGDCGAPLDCNGFQLLHRVRCQLLLDEIEVGRLVGQRAFVQPCLEDLVREAGGKWYLLTFGIALT